MNKIIAILPIMVLAGLSLPMSVISIADAFEVAQIPPVLPTDPYDRDPRIPLPPVPPIDPYDPRAPLPPRIPINPRDRDSNGDYSVFYRRSGRERWRLAGSYRNHYEVERVKRDLRRDGYIVRVEYDEYD
jgi:hypothetical protein